MKEFKTYEEQIELLKLNGLIILDEAYAKEKLKEENYYNIINGYKELFMNLHKNDTFITDVTFEEYDLDRIIKNVVFKSILQVENILRSLISYEFSKKYGNDNYLKLENFETLKDSGCNYEKYQKRVAQIQTLLANLQSDIAKAITKRAYINHYILNYGFIPL